MRKRQILIFFLCHLGCLSVFAQADSTVGDLFAPGAAPRLIARSFRFTEGPVADKKGNIYFTDQPNDRIWKYGTHGKISLFLEGARRSNGLSIDRKGRIIACADSCGQLIAIDRQRRITVLTEKHEGRSFNGPNDLWIAANGTIYFTDPYYRRSYHKSGMPELKKEQVYYLPPGSATALVADTSLIKPNGIAGTPDGRQLYIADIKDNKTYRFNIRPDGSLGDRSLFTSQGSDGVTTDSRGNVYLTGNGVTVFDSTGRKIAWIAVPEKWTANLCFGGRNGNLLFITASEGVYVMEMKVRGL